MSNTGVHMLIGKSVPVPRGIRLLWAFGIPVLLAACGGGGEDESWNYGPSREITGTKIVQITPVAVGGVPVYFSGGECSGGNGPLRVRWTYDTNEGSAGVHTFPVPTPPKVSETHNVVVKCTDSSGQDLKWFLDTLSVTVYAPGFTP